jgi:hemolysin III
MWRDHDSKQCHGPDMSNASVYTYSAGEEIAHAVTHGVGAVLSVVGLVVLVVYATLYGTAVHVVGSAVFGASLFVLYASSTLYHAMPVTRPGAKGLLKHFDHAAIYLLIAGTYTPVTLFALSAPWGMRLFGIVWGLAVVGLAFTASPLRRHRRFALALYLGMGWLVVVAAKPIFDALPLTALLLFVAGGLAYTVGVVFYVRKRKWSHTIWHGFVLAGSALHFFAILSLLAR